MQCEPKIDIGRPSFECIDVSHVARQRAHYTHTHTHAHTHTPPHFLLSALNVFLRRCLWRDFFRKSSSFSSYSSPFKRKRGAVSNNQQPEVQHVPHARALTHAREGGGYREREVGDLSLIGRHAHFSLILARARAHTHTHTYICRKKKKKNAAHLSPAEMRRKNRVKDVIVSVAFTSMSHRHCPAEPLLLLEGLRQILASHLSLSSLPKSAQKMGGSGIKIRQLAG